MPDNRVSMLMNVFRQGLRRKALAGGPDSQAARPEGPGTRGALGLMGHNLASGRMNQMQSQAVQESQMSDVTKAAMAERRQERDEMGGGTLGGTKRRRSLGGITSAGPTGV